MFFRWEPDSPTITSGAVGKVAYLEQGRVLIKINYHYAKA